jgi:puromycin-sensitive aminopeptidase
MLEQYLGADKFREGVSHYLSLHSYKNTETNDLWDAIEETSGEPVRRIMDSWIWQPGFPLISSSLSGGGTNLDLSQQRFSFEKSTNDQTWVVPVHIRNGDEEMTILLDAETATVQLPHPDAVVVVNAGGHGFYRVSYDDGLRARLSGKELTALSTLERYSLIDDAWSSTVAGRLSAVEMLSFLEGFIDEHDHAVWQAIAIALRGISRLVSDEATTEFEVRVRALVEPALASLGEPTHGEPDLDAKLRGLLTATLGVLGGDEATQARCRELFAQATSDANSVDPELTAAATSVVAATGDAADYERMLDGFLNATTPQDELRHLYALADFDNEALILRTCEFVMGDQVKTQNAPFVLRMAIGNRRHGTVAWDFVKQNWERANAEFPTNTIVRMIDSVKSLTTPELVADVQAFFAENPIDQATKTLAQILERQDVNAALLARDAEALNVALRV